MLYDRHLMQPTFRLSIGNPGSSFAVEIARKIGLPEYIISEAEAIVGSDYINMDKYLLDIARDKRYWENKRIAIRQKEKKLELTLSFTLSGRAVAISFAGLDWRFFFGAFFSNGWSPISPAGTIRILHGTGTGALRQYLRQYLDTIDGIKSYRDEHVQFGGAGITVVELK